MRIYNIKKLVFLLALIVNIVPILKHGEITIYGTTAISAQDYSSEGNGGSPGAETCAHVEPVLLFSDNETCVDTYRHYYETIVCGTNTVLYDQGYADFYVTNTTCLQAKEDTPDCNGDYGGTAYIDNCDNCVGGNTGAVACTSPVTPPVSTTVKYQKPMAPISAKSLSVLQKLMNCAGLTSVTITSTYRSPQRQAVIMYNNIVKKGPAHSYGLYGKNGRLVVDVYVSENNAGYASSQIISDMTNEIYQLGPFNVSHHCSNSTTDAPLFDIDPNSISNTPAFISCVQAEVGGDVNIFLYPSKDTSFHIEVNQ